MPSPPSDPNEAFFNQLDAYNRRIAALESILAGSGAVAPPPPGSAYIPIGGYLAYPVSTPPAGFLVCNGQFVSKATYAALFGVIGVAYGDGGSTFGLPNLNRRAPFGSGSGMNVSENDGMAETSRGPLHHHRVTGGVSISSVGDHTHPAVGDHAHNEYAQSFFAQTKANTGTRGTASTTFMLVSDYWPQTDVAGGHQHGSAGGHGHSGSVDFDTSGGAAQDKVGYLVVLWMIRAT